MRNVLLDLEKTAKSLYGIDLAYFDDVFLNQTVERRCEITETEALQGYLAYLSHNETEAQNLAQS